MRQRGGAGRRDPHHQIRLRPAWIRCPVVGARKLARDGKVTLGWSTARVTAIPKRSLQCFKCLELGHVRATCTSNVASCQGVSHLRAKVTVVQVAGGASQSQDVRGGMCSAESEEEATDPRTDRGGNARGEHCRTSRGGWPGGGHGSD
jgi:hypothetical protein